MLGGAPLDLDDSAGGEWYGSEAQLAEPLLAIYWWGGGVGGLLGGLGP